MRRRRAFILASTSAGHGRGLHFVSSVAERLRSSYRELAVFLSPSKEEGRERVIAEAEKESDIIVLGGDGTFNAVVNSLAEAGIKATLGYVNAGTLGDIGRNFGISRRVGNAVEIIKRGHLVDFDVVRASSKEKSAYFAYMLACGAYSEIPYVAGGYRKALLGRFDYYRLALSDALKKQELRYRLIARDLDKEGESPFLLFLNGRRVAGFPVNQRGDIGDGLFEGYIASKGAFNGLLHYLYRKNLYQCRIVSCRIEVDEEIIWCLDGEPLLHGSLDLEIVPKAFKIYAADK